MHFSCSDLKGYLLIWVSNTSPSHRSCPGCVHVECVQVPSFPRVLSTLWVDPHLIHNAFYSQFISYKSKLPHFSRLPKLSHPQPSPFTFHKSVIFNATILLYRLASNSHNHIENQALPWSCSIDHLKFIYFDLISHKEIILNLTWE